MTPINPIRLTELVNLVPKPTRRRLRRSRSRIPITSEDPRKQNPKAFAFSSSNKAKCLQSRAVEKEQRRLHAPIIDRSYGGPDSEGDEDGATSDDDIESSEEEEEDGNDNHDTNGVSFFVRVVAMEEAVLVLALVGKLRRHLLLLVVAMVLVLLVSSFASPLSDEEKNKSFSCIRACGCLLFQLNELFLTEPQKARIYHYYVPVFLWCEQQITEHQSKFKDGEDIPPLVVCYILVTLSAIVLFIFILIWKN
ncbi:D-glycerate 3-kinase, chloroplastic [Glycine soja]|uniref:D-glycerate 3-kinase, chloroplastic n=1 Tax=Glycine soja TaxID=3848 RepID=A0A0B2Q5K7_GLYSO|nr:D-glycerate 3-kinase, chloroplastic [Glycine soja]